MDTNATKMLKTEMTTVKGCIGVVESYRVVLCRRVGDVSMFADLLIWRVIGLTSTTEGFHSIHTRYIHDVVFITCLLRLRNACGLFME